MITLILAAVLPVQVACTNCNGVGYFEVKCPRCEGRGLIPNPRGFGARVKLPDGSWTHKVPCPNCTHGAIRADSKGSGKKKVTCKVCRGNKKIRK